MTGVVGAAERGVRVLLDEKNRGACLVKALDNLEDLLDQQRR